MAHFCFGLLVGRLVCGAVVVSGASAVVVSGASVGASVGAAVVGQT